jgi:hypothetical protein
LNENDIFNEYLNEGGIYMKNKFDKIKRSTAGYEALQEAERQNQLSEISSTGGMGASASIRANQNKKKAEKILSLDSPLELGAGNEALPPEVEDPKDDDFYHIRETLKSGADYINLDASNQRTDLAADLNCLAMALDASESINARNSLEKMIAHQAASCHYVSMLLLNQAVESSYHPCLSIEANKKRVDIQAKQINSSVRLMNTCYRSLQAFQGLRTYDKKNITVQYTENIHEVGKFALKKNPVVVAVRELMNENETWESSATELLNALEIYVPEKIKKSSVWPKSANVLSGKLKRYAFYLKTVGIEIVTGIKEGKGKRKIVMRKITKKSASCATHTEKNDKPLI